MLCVTITQPRHRGILAQHRFLAEHGVSLVEMRLDHLQTRVNFTRLLSNRPTPVIITIRRPCDGGEYQFSEDSRQMLLRAAIVEGVEYIDLEDGVAADTPRYGKTKRIISYHNFQQTPENLDEIFERLAKQDPDIIKICTMANNPLDTLRMLKLVEQKNKLLPTIGFCMGDFGIPSRILCTRFGAPFTYCCMDSRSPAAPGQISWEEMTQLYRVDKISEKTQIYGVIADPVGHSLSPLIHNSAFAHLQMDDHLYLPLRVQQEFLNEMLETICPELNIKGLSITIPHKESVLPKLDKRDTSVNVVGACNTLLWAGSPEEKIRVGINTDYQAAMTALAEVMNNPEIPQYTPWTEPNDDPETGMPIKQPLSGKSVLILGAGGVGKAVAIGAARRGAEIILADGETSRADDLAHKLNMEGYNARSILWTQRHFCKANILINCTPIGMYPRQDATPFEAKYLNADMTVFDVVYNPENTLLLKEAKQAGCATVSGLSMFVLQAGLQFQHFTGIAPPLEIMRDVVKKATSTVKW
ncbi:MAG: type I 3-dehydroquinate dehydratase [Planctomycetia bacterium]|nr:type I 3-dehydroquinate dehydratase [Planctomycetia bacterium]